jgi:hypothetical protein
MSTNKATAKTAKTNNKVKHTVHHTTQHIAAHAQRAHRATKISSAAVTSIALAALRENDNEHNRAMLALSETMRAYYNSERTQEELRRIGDAFAKEMVRWNNTRETINDDPTYSASSVPVSTFQDDVASILNRVEDANNGLEALLAAMRADDDIDFPDGDSSENDED